MTNKEFYLYELETIANDLKKDLRCKLWELRKDECSKDWDDCGGSCNTCLFLSLKWLDEEHKEKIKLKKVEYDMLTICSGSWKFENAYIHLMKAKGYFKGITNTTMKIADILENCEVEEDE